VNLLQAIESQLPAGYKLGERIGVGATSWVYLAERDDATESLVVKVLQPGIMKRDSVERFLREFRVMQQLAHPRIIPVIASGEAGGAMFFTMPYMGRTTLRMRLAAEGALSIRDALAITGDITQALGFAHKKGVVHRDVKPENILLGDDGGAHLMDFGFANAPSLMADETVSAEARLIIGTPDYVSPEQITGKRSGDWRSDFYSLGCVLYEMLTGAPPHAGGSARSAMKAHVDSSAPDVRTVRADTPDDVAGIVRRCLERSPNDRFATAFHLQIAVENAVARLDGAAISAG
jgi:eukaryotic-like serine/threonine-protein kinase